MENWRITILESLNVSLEDITWVEQVVIAACLLLLLVVVDKLTKIFINRFVTRFVLATKVKWDDILLERKVINKLVAILPAILLVVFTPFIFVNYPWLYDLTQRLCWIYLIAIVLAFILSALSALVKIFSQHDSFKDKPIKGAVQMVQVLVTLISVIIMVAIMIDKSPVFLLTGLGASAAVLMLVFQDLILGLVAGIQLSANKMLQVGDWIEVKDKGIDGNVIEVSLTTVKVQNWDYTVSTIQPQALVSGSFINWSNMFRSGGRRIARTIHIDMRSVRFMTMEEIEKWRENKLVSQFINDTIAQIDTANITGDTFSADALRITNLTLFRHYLLNFIQANPASNENFISMVRLQQPTAQGVPLQLYFFTKDTAWIKYEGVQSRVFEYIFAIIPQFGLRVYQAPSGDDISSLQANS